MTDDEIWKPVRGYVGFYEVSNKGRVRGAPRTVECVRLGKKILRSYDYRILALQDRNGYLHACLAKDGDAEYQKVHRIVAFAFLPIDPERNHVAHGDGNPKNNALSNLRWCNRKENEADKVLHGKTNRGERCGSAKLNNKQIRQIKLDLLHKKQSEIARQFSVDQSTISNINRKRNWIHG